MSLTVQIVISVFLLGGMVCCLGGSLGLLRFPDVFCRLHALGSPITLGMLSFLIAAFIYFIAAGHGINGATVVCFLFILLTSPVATHLISKAAYHSGIKPCAKTVQDDLAAHAKDMELPVEED